MPELAGMELEMLNAETGAIKLDVLNRWSGVVEFTAEISCDPNSSIGFKLRLAVKWAIRNRADLRDADLSGAYLRDADLGGVDLRGVDLRGADLRDANLGGANLRGANLGDADLRDANLRGANLRGANLRDANLGGANLSGANLRGANLSGVDLSGVDLSGADLSGAYLRSFKADYWMTLTENRNEVVGLIKAIREGRVNGSQYSGECSCLKGTLATVKGVDVSTFTRNSREPAEQWFLMISEGDAPDKDTGGGFAAKMALEWALEWCKLNGVEVS